MMISRRFSVLEDFFGIDLRTLALVRILAGVTVLATLLILFQDVAEFFTDDGIYPRSHWLRRSTNPYVVSVHVIRGEYWWQAFLFGVHGIFALMLMVGYKTRLASIVTWLLLLSLFHRTPPILHGGDTLLSLLLLWGALTPWGARLSVDGALNTVREIPRRVTSIATAGLILQMPLVYLFTMFLKLKDDSWRFPDLSAVYYSLSPEFVTPLGARLVANQPFWATQAKTVFTMLAEGVGPVLMFLPLLIFAAPGVRRKWLGRLRWVAIGALTLMQFGLALTVSLGLFPLISTLGLLAALPESMWDRWARSQRVHRAARTAIFFDPHCLFCRKMARLAQEFLLPRSAPVQEASDDPAVHERMVASNSWIVRDAEGRLHEGYAAFLVLLQASPWAFWLHGIARICAPVGECVYSFIASNRRLMGYLTDGLELRPYRVRAGVVATILSALLFGHMWLSNVESVVYSQTDEWITSSEFRRFEIGLQINQNWRLFISPNYWSSYYVVRGELRDGTEVELFAGGPSHLSREELSWAPPTQLDSHQIYKNYRWRRYLQSIRVSGGTPNRQPYGSYFCRTWNAAHSGDDQVEMVRIYRMVLTRDLLREPFADEPEARLFWRHWCFGRPDNE